MRALTLIAFIGSVFSPYYAWANRKSPALPENFCAMNIALYHRRGSTWGMTERNAAALTRTESTLRIGPSNLHWDGDALTAELSEWSAPIPRRVRGHITLRPDIMQDEVFLLDPAGRHRWRPIAPKSRIEVRFENPGLSWFGHAYFDHNNGDVPLAHDFSEWHWSRSNTRIYYDATLRDGTRNVLGLAINPKSRIEIPPEQTLPTGFWGVRRITRATETPKLLKTLEDAPFYARSLIESDNEIFVHESLDLDRFKNPVVQAMLPFRMPRKNFL